MWRTVLSIAAVVLNFGLLVLVAVMLLGFAVNASRRALTASDFAVLGMVAAVAVGAVVNVLAIALGARLRDRKTASAAQVASEFS
jgi:hypothetical protein